MEVNMEYFAKICITVMIILTVVFCVFIFIKIKKAIETRILLHQENHIEILPYKLLKINFSNKTIMRRVFLPFTQEPDSKLFCVDLIIVNNGGILLISIKDFKGSIENPFKGDWRQFYNNNIIQFCNPLEENSIHSRAINKLFKNEKMNNIPIRSAVCYLDGKTRFKNKIEQILTADKLVPYIKDMSKNRFLSKKEINNSIHIIQKNRKHVKKLNEKYNTQK